MLLRGGLQEKRRAQCSLISEKKRSSLKKNEREREKKLIKMHFEKKMKKHVKKMNTARKLGPHTPTDRGAFSGVGLLVHYKSHCNTGGGQKCTEE